MAADVKVRREIVIVSTVVVDTLCANICGTLKSFLLQKW